MATLLKGITVRLLQKYQIGVDEINEPIYEEEPIEVENVLIAPLSDEEIIDTLNLTGRRAVYQLAIPKTDNHNWENQRVEFFGEVWQVIGKPVKGIDYLIPLDWNMKVKVEGIGGA